MKVEINDDTTNKYKRSESNKERGKKIGYKSGRGKKDTKRYIEKIMRHGDLMYCCLLFG
jgi:hypothetical protein